MKPETWLFSGGMLFFFPVAFVYGLFTQWQEWVGFIALLLTGGLALLVGVYLFITARRIDPRPEDDLRADITEGAGEQGFFPAYSWWPLYLSAACAVVFLGAAIGWWLWFIGLVFTIPMIIGWVYEHYVGEYAH
ncbi:cytochrome c oxidase subunit 4 [Paenibacillus sp. TRM 82003]|uniref:cytochrome c oxidase subunit 4 n=1 Tax=Kineococcus sp. TRM81007 TaxID=2925831 RepID=UPI001F5A9A2F|nr:cytochrome c oxidase subunit 4 [Kineococcus sp. TRM81007]MCI2239654.1 cytochrome c oxidase subunit 4 [Kineococcus sp. TRM81007]MCI3926782.1 cytochrome c oxidase subunit 4 [Paenibacillus sp. TRM 82003]